MAKPKGKKSWYTLVAPKMFQEMQLGETVVYEPEHMIGKKIKANLMSLTNDIKTQNVNMTFEVNKIQEKKGLTTPVGYNMIPSSVKRMVRRRCNKIDLSFTCETADNKQVIIKPLIVTRSLTTGVVKNRLRKTVLASVMNRVKKMNYEALVQDLIRHKFQFSLRGDMKKIHPLKTCEIRTMKLVNKSSASPEAKKAPVKESKPAPKVQEAPKKEVKEVKETPKEAPKAEEKKE